jgi:hypothetical protein
MIEGLQKKMIKRSKTNQNKEESNQEPPTALG